MQKKSKKPIIFCNCYKKSLSLQQIFKARKVKKYLLAIVLLAYMTGAAWAQSETKQELNVYAKNGLVKFESADGKYLFRMGGRLLIDGAHYFNDYTVRGSGARFGEARIRMYGTLGEKLDAKFDVDLAPSRPILRDVFLRWHTNPSGFVMVGNFIEPFSPEDVQSLFDYAFITNTATVEALGTGRSLGISYRYYHPNFWGEAGVFSQKVTAEPKPGNMGYALSTRLLGRIEAPDFNLHMGGSLNYRRPDAAGFTNGSDRYNRYVTPASILESCVDKTQMLGGVINHVKSTFKYAVDIMASYRHFFVTGEYIHAKNIRVRDWEYDYRGIPASIATIAPTLETYKTLCGEDTPVQLSGYTVQAGYIILGGNYQYNQVDALMGHADAGTLELVARYNHTDLNDMKGGIFHDGRFYDTPLNISLGLANGTYVGGMVNSYTIGLNYYFTKYVIAKINYGYQKLNQAYNVNFQQDKKLQSIQARLAIEF